MRAIAIALIGAALTAPATAEPGLFQETALGRSDGVVAIGISIPFAGRQQKVPPRVELRIARDQVNMDGGRRSSRADFTPMESRIGFSLESDSELLINGRPISGTQRSNISTVGWVAVGVGAVLIGGFLLVADAARDASD